MQPTIQTANAVGVEGLPTYDNCQGRVLLEDPISMNTVRSGNTVKTLHAEKEVFDCFLAQGNLPVIVDVTTYLELYENIDDKEVIETNAISTTCIKDASTAIVIDCESAPVSTKPVFVGDNCAEVIDEITHPQEMNTVVKGNKAKTVEAQKEVFVCQLPDNTFKKIDIVLFTEIYENLTTQTTDSVQFTSARYVIIKTDSASATTEGDLQDASVESCIFTSIAN